jgi:hypothetical protein
MKYWTEYYGHEKKIKGKRKKYDTNIYTLDIESTSYLILNGKQKNVTEYLKLTEKEQKECKKQGCMYIWMFGINSDVYYGRTWNELKFFLNNLENVVPEQKFLFIHNQSFEFQFMKSVFSFADVVARKAHKVMVSILKDYNITIKCSYYMSNCALKYLPDLYDLPVEKKVGDLDYTLIRTPATKLTDLELGYCENDILVLYYYIKYEIETYEDVKHIPNTSTGHVRRELKEKIEKDYAYKNLCRKSINVDPHVFNLLQSAFMRWLCT